MATILVVDDDAVIRRLCSTLLQKAGHVVLTSANGPDATKILDSGAVDLVLSDVAMPDMSGIELLRLIHQRNPDTQVIIMTGFATVDVAVDALKEGANDFIRKPFETVEFIRVVDRCLESRQQAQELKQARQDLEATVDQLRRSNSAKANLIAMIAHDVRAPLVGMRTVLELMLANKRTKRQELEETMEDLRSTVTRIASLLDNLLDFSRLEAGRLELRLSTFDVRDAIEECVQGWRHLSAGHPIEISGTFGRVQADRERVIQILSNLLSNALKFSRDKSEVRIKGSIQGDSLCMAVEDSGIGIPSEESDLVFDRFYRSRHEQVKHIPGAGLGLSIVKSLVALHGGRVWAESRLGAGSTFYVTLPLAQAEAESRQESAIEQKV